MFGVDRVEMLAKLSVTAINLYQHYISPHKGYCCAHRAYTGEDSCSQYAKVAIQDNGLFSAFPLIRKQFNRCSFAADEIKKEHEKKKKEKNTTAEECAFEAACQYVECCGNPIPKSCFRKKSSNSSYDHCDIGGCDAVGDCHPFH